MSEHRAWGGREEGMWWPGAIATDQQTLPHQQFFQQQIDEESNQQQTFNYKMSNNFQNPPTTVSNATSASPIGAAGIRGYDYSMAGGNPTLNTPTQGAQWWYPPSSMDNMHSTLQSLQNSIHGMQQQQQMPPVHNPSSPALQQHHQILSQAPLPQKGRMPRAKADAKPRGRMTAYAFFVQTCREEHKKKHPEENVVFAEFSKKCAERWKTMLDKEKKRFHEMAEMDKKRYNTEMQSYTPPAGEKQRGKKRKQVKDPNAPKRSLSAFFWFSNDERGKVKAQNPEYGVGDIAKELGRRWADADQESKGKYEALADKDKIRYEKEMTAYKMKNNPAMKQMGHPVPEVEEAEDEEEVDEEDDE